MEERLLGLIKDWSFVHGQGSSGLCGGTMKEVEIILAGIKPYIRDAKLDKLFDNNSIDIAEELRKMLHININKTKFVRMSRINVSSNKTFCDDPYTASDVIIKNIFELGPK